MVVPPPLRTMDDSILRAVGWTKKPHILHTRWHMWYHNPNERDYSKSSFTDLFPKPIECLEELILLFNSWDESLPDAGKGMFYLMRETTKGPIYPCREDPHNQNGGYWTSKIDSDNAMEVWKKLCFLMVNETVVEDWQKINGVSITPKQGFCLVKIWNGKDDTSDMSQLKTYLANFLDMSACMYFNNKMKIAIDSRRQTKYSGGGGGGGGGTYSKKDRDHKDRGRQHSRRSPQAFKSKSSRTPKQAPISTSKPIIKPSFSGGWRDLLQTQTSLAKPGFKSYTPPGIKGFKTFD